MRRFVTLAVLLLFTIPFGISISGCSHKAPVVYCNGGDSGPVVGQVKTITLTPRIYGLSLNYAQEGTIGTPTSLDCKGSNVSVTTYSWGTVDGNGKPDMTIADVNPTSGRVCAGTWNRNTGGGIADYTTCIPNNKTGTTYVVASAQGASSNPLPIYVHAVATSVVLGPLSSDCLNDPATNCSPAVFINSPTSCTVDPGTGCCTQPVAATSVPLDASQSCFSQGVTGQLAARVYAGTGTGTQNISCQVGHLSYSPQSPTIVSIDQNGVATALQPGSTTVTANVASAGSSAGFFSTCPPASISLTVPGGGTSVTVNANNTQPLTATVLDTNGNPLTGLALSFQSTTPTTIPAGSPFTPIFPGAASLTAICQPPSCNPAPFNQIGLYGNGKPVSSNPVHVTSIGSSSTVLYIGSTQSQYIVPVDFTTGVVGNPIRLPYVPNSMVISEDGSTIYMGNSVELMTFSTLSNGLTAQDTSVNGSVLAVSPDNNTIVISDPVRQLIYLYSRGAVTTSYGGVGTHAVFTPDSSAVYITLGTPDASGNVTPNNNLLVHSTAIGWYFTSSPQPTRDIAVAVPSEGAFFAGAPTSARGYCPITTTTGTGEGATTNNIFYPDAGVNGPATDRVTATNDGLHILGAQAVSGAANFTDLALGTTGSPGVPVGPCPSAGGLVFTNSPLLSNAPLPGVNATAITGVSATSDSSVAFVTYTGTGGVLPIYTTAASGAGTLSNIALASSASGTPTAPVAGVISSDDTTFYIGTSGDNVVHLINRRTLTDNPANILAPTLPNAAGQPSVPNLLVQHPRKQIS
jgi:trimeric autotransporter adhesin